MAHDNQGLAGKRFGRLIVLEKCGSIKKKGYSRSIWLCRCDCGKEVTTNTVMLTSGHKQSCGCLLNEAIHRPRGPRPDIKPRISAAIRKEWQALRAIWKGMKYRCYNENCEEYHRYGGRGIKICDDWFKSSKYFAEWALQNGYKLGMSIDRINNDGNYEPSNCQFLTRGENASKGRKKLITISGITLSQSEWSALAYRGAAHRFSSDKCRNGYEFAYNNLVEALKRFDYAR